MTDRDKCKPKHGPLMVGPTDATPPAVPQHVEREHAGRHERSTDEIPTMQLQVEITDAVLDYQAERIADRLMYGRLAMLAAFSVGVLVGAAVVLGW